MIDSPRNPDVRDWLPPWIGSLGVAVWVSDPHGDVVFMNAEAEGLMGRSGHETAGSPCHRMVRGTNACGVPLCRNFCAVRMLAGNHAKLEPIQMRVPGAGGRWIQVMVIALTAPDGSYPWLVHCATDAERSQRMERYLTLVASRSDRAHEEDPEPLEQLSAREREILERLGQDRNLQDIASELFISYVTVRNHVQHILAKLRVHSIEEAVARLLLDDAA